MRELLLLIWTLFLWGTIIIVGEVIKWVAAKHLAEAFKFALTATRRLLGI